MINHFWPRLNLLEVGSYLLPFFFFPSFSFFLSLPPSSSSPSLLPLPLFFFLPFLPPSSSSPSRPASPIARATVAAAATVAQISPPLPPPPPAPCYRVRDCSRCRRCRAKSPPCFRPRLCPNLSRARHLPPLPTFVFPLLAAAATPPCPKLLVGGEERNRTLKG